MRACAFDRDHRVVERFGSIVFDLSAGLGIAQEFALLKDGIEYRHLADDIDRLEIVHRLEHQRALQRTAVAAREHIVHGLQTDARNALLEHFVEIIAIDIDDLAILVLRQRRFRVYRTRVAVA